jgi:hypothetical protein
MKNAPGNSYGRRPSSSGSHVSVISVEPMDVFWWRPAILLWNREEILGIIKDKTNGMTVLTIPCKHILVSVLISMRRCGKIKKEN